MQEDITKTGDKKIDLVCGIWRANEARAGIKRTTLSVIDPSHQISQYDFLFLENKAHGLNRVINKPVLVVIKGMKRGCC